MPTIQLATTFHAFPGRPPAGWAAAARPVPYRDAVAAMESRAERIAAGEAPELVWLLEHPPLYTAGTSAHPDDLRTPRFPVIPTGRGGRHTYHGPGQRVAYVMLDLRRRRPDVRAFVGALEAWVAGALARFGLAAGPRGGRVGVWVARPDKPPGPGGAPAEDKVAAIGVRLRRWVSFHGVSVNVDPDLSHFGGIVPCGIADAHLGVTSLADLGRGATMAEVDAALRASFEEVFGATVDAPQPDAPARPAAAEPAR